TIAFNVVPRVERFDPEGSGFTTEEIKMGNEIRKVLDLPELRAVATAVRVPVAVGHGVSIYATFARPVEPEAARRVLSEARGVRFRRSGEPRSSRGRSRPGGTGRPRGSRRW